MARTPLMNMLQRLAKDAAIARAKNVSISTVQEWRAQAKEEAKRRGPTRREVLTGAGAVAAALALPKISKANPQPRIAIIGAGIAGLSCALELSDKGIASTVFEASTRIGGRMHSNNQGYWNEGQVSEWCGELIDTDHLTIKHLAQRFRLDLVDLKAAEPNGSEDTFYFNGTYYPRSQANSDFTNFVHPVLQRAVQDASYPTTYNISTAAGRVIDNTTLYDWIEQNIVGGHAGQMGAMLDVAYTEELAANTNIQSALNMIYLLGYNATPGNFEMFGISDERFHIVGGNQQLPEAIAAYLGVGSTVQLGWKMTSLQLKGDGTYDVGFSVGGSAKMLNFDYVVVAIPFPVLRNLDISKAGFDPLKMKTINELGAGKSGKLQLQFTQRYWNQPGPWPGVSNGNGYSDTGFQNTWDVTRAQNGVSGIMVDYTGGPVSAAMKTPTPYAFIGDTGVSQDVQTFLKRVDPVFPGLRNFWNGKATSSLPHLDPNLMQSYAFWKVGQCQTIAGYEIVRQANCLFAGEHTSVNMQGFMEGGAETGIEAGDTILKDLKLI